MSGFYTHTVGKWKPLGPGVKKYHTLCQCECGTIRELYNSNLKKGTTKSCVRCKNGRQVTHGVSRSKFYLRWFGMVQRCTNPNHASAEHYHDRGITVCERWLKYENFRDDMGEPPPGYTLDRKDNEKGYWCGKVECSECGFLAREPNCEWKTQAAQNRNKRGNVNITFGTETKCISDWAKQVGITAHALKRRIKMWGVEKALTTPKLKQSEFRRGFGGVAIPLAPPPPAG